jgi:translation initiation factor IF-1
VAALADELGVPLLPWQNHVLDDALARSCLNGNWARSQVGVLVARQCGKTHMMRMRILAGLYIFGDRNAIAMSQTRQLSLDTFKQTVDMAESLDWMRKRIKRVSRTNGQEELEVYCHHYPKACGQKCERIRKYSIRAATSEGPRGASADLLYVDELREIDEPTWAAVTPITRARPNAQVFWTSNAGDLTSNVLNEQRRRALTFASDRMGTTNTARQQAQPLMMSKPGKWLTRHWATQSTFKTLRMRQPLTAPMPSRLRPCVCGLMP